VGKYEDEWFLAHVKNVKEKTSLEYLKMNYCVDSRDLTFTGNDDSIIRRNLELKIKPCNEASPHSRLMPG